MNSKSTTEKVWHSFLYNSLRKPEIIFVGGFQGPPDPETGEQLPGADPDARAKSRLSGISVFCNPDQTFIEKLADALWVRLR